MILDRGVVFKIEGSQALVEVVPPSECRGCTACQVFSSGKKGLAAENAAGAGVGDRVQVEVSPAAGVAAPIIAFGIPILFFLIGVVSGSLLSELFSILFGVLFLAAGMLLVRLLDRSIAGQKIFKCRIVRILN